MPITTTTTTARTRRSSLPVAASTTVWHDKHAGGITRIDIWTKNHEGKDILLEITGGTLRNLLEQITR
jgi:hypothetical protein